MRKISNNISEIAQGLYTKIFWNNFLDKEEIEKLTQYCKAFEVQRATISSENPTINDEIRISNTNFHNRNNENAWIFDRINHAVEEINSKFYHFDLHGYNYFQYSEYLGSNKGKYDFHMDTFMDSESLKLSSTRKLSLVLLLSEPGVDFEGGDFQMNTSNEQQCETINMQKGTLIAFPSFLLHRVTPVSKGVRRSIAIWVEGPKFK